MSALSTSNDPSVSTTPSPGEPFGQAGVRQYAGRLLAWCFVTLALAGFAMAHRSGLYADVVDWQGKGQRLQVVSGNGQLALRGGADEQIKGEGQWGYRGGYGGNRWANRLPWRSSVGETVGFEAAMQSPFRDIARGFSVRVRWTSLGCLALVQPVVYVTRLLLRKRRGDGAEDV